MGKVTQVKNGKYIGADKYTVTDTSDGKKQITFSPDQVLEQGTPVGAEILNEIQKNGLYYLTGTHRVDGQESIYDCTLVGIGTFEFTQLNVLFKPNIAPTQATVKLNIGGQIYTLTEKLINANQIGLLLVKSEMKAYTWGTKIAIVNDLTTGGADKAGSAEMVKKLGEDKQDKTDNELKTDSKKIVGAINESLYHTIPKEIGNTSTDTPLSSIIKDGVYFSNQGTNIISDAPDGFNKLLTLLHFTQNSTQTGYRANQIVFSCRENRMCMRRRETNNPYGSWIDILNETTPIFLGISGIPKKRYIQDSGTKTIDELYYDKDTGKIYIAKETNDDVTVTSKFGLATNQELAKRQNKINYINVANAMKVDKQGDIIHNTNTKSSQKFTIKSEGLYSINAYGYLEVNKKIELKINGILVATAPWANNSTKSGALVYNKALKENDVIEVTNSDSIGFSRSDSGVSIVMIK